jgi:hypothetical protein
MRSIVTLATAAAVVLHALLGCCAHHAHAVEASEDQPTSRICSHAHHDHEHGPVSEQPGPTDSDPETPCGDAECAFLLAGKLVVDGADCYATLPVGFIGPASANTSTLAATIAVDSGGPVPTPVRLHLLHQILLN